MLYTVYIYKRTCVFSWKSQHPIDVIYHFRSSQTILRVVCKTLDKFNFRPTKEHFIIITTESQRELQRCSASATPPRFDKFNFLPTKEHFIIITTESQRELQPCSASATPPRFFLMKNITIQIQTTNESELLGKLLFLCFFFFDSI